MMNRYSLSIAAFAGLAFAASCAPAVEPEAPVVDSEPVEGAVAPINQASEETEVEEQPVADVAEADADSVSEPVEADQPSASAEDEDHDHSHSDGEDHNHEGDDHHDHDEHDHDHADGDDHDHDHGGEAHVHGKADMAIAIEGNNLSVSFESPLYNLIGFEHEPKTEEESAAYNGMRDTLANSDSVIVFSEAAECAHYSSETSIRRNGDHATLIADYEFTCDDMSELVDGSVSAFGVFSGLEKMDLVVVSDTDQDAAFLTADNSSFDISP
ncbi:MAG: DUF2796 domain-containing protein [Henriciella sp.]|nr:DUF2796 domain-containing protein [Henriciella sp.]